MAEVIRFRKEFLPHIIRLFCPEVQKVDSRLDYFQQLFALYQPAPEQSCLLVKGRDKLLACAYLVSLDSQRNLVYINLALDGGLDSETWGIFWQQCVNLAMTLVSGAPVLRVAAVGDIPPYLSASGFQLIREQVELHAVLGQLPPVQTAPGDFHVLSLADHPDQEEHWLDVFNMGATVFWDLPIFNRESLQRLRSAPGFDASHFRLGMDGAEPVSALYYSVLDSNLGMVRINAAATPPGKRSRGFGRRMIKETLNHLEKEGMKEAVIYTEASNQATNLLFKMLGFVPKGNINIFGHSLERATQASLPEVAAAEDVNQEVTEGQGFFPGFHTAFNGKKRQ